MQTLVVFFSRDGHTRTVGDLIAKELASDSEEILEITKRSGPIGFMKSGFEASQGKLAKILPIKKDPSGYDLIVIGTPIWARNVSSPVRTYIVENNAKFKNVAFFCTEGSTGSEEAFTEMEKISGKKPKSTLRITTEDQRKGATSDMVKKFAAELKS